MSENRFDIVFKYRDAAIKSHHNLKFDDIKIMMEQDEAIRHFAELIKKTTLEYKPILYSRS